MAARSGKRSRTLAIVLVVELLIGAVIWFSSMPSDAEAEPISATSAPAPTAPAPVEARKDCPPAPKAWKPKMCVTHVEHGKGTIIAATGIGGTAELVVEFDSGQKTVTGKSVKSCKRSLSDDLLPIGILIIVITIVIIRLPKVELGHT